MRHPEHYLSADDVLRELVIEGEAIGGATVYRILAQFCASEMASCCVTKTSERGKPKMLFRWGRKSKTLGHLVCQDSGVVSELSNPAIERLLKEEISGMGYELADFWVTTRARSGR